jgi:hypothetical protein
MYKSKWWAWSRQAAGVVAGPGARGPTQALGPSNSGHARPQLPAPTAQGHWRYTGFSGHVWRYVNDKTMELILS